ncbi:MAG TPA: hypothetical protein VER17_19370 [Tepidisphaeraceae bacterium]|nr:hypothetical protein [Tepidisphaeraceae bacterium]
MSGGFLNRWDEYYLEEIWVQAGRDDSGSWGAPAHLSGTFHYSQSEELAMEAGWQTPDGASITVSKSYTEQVGQSSNYDSLRKQDANAQYDITLYVKKRRIIHVSWGLYRSANGTVTPISTTTKVHDEGYVFGDDDFVIRSKQREPIS